MNATTINKAQDAIRRYLELKGFEIIEQGWAHGNDSIEFIARDEETLVFVGCTMSQNTGEGMPSEGIDRKAFERIAAAYLTEHGDETDMEIRYDHVHLLVIGESRALLRHHTNALSEVG